MRENIFKVINSSVSDDASPENAIFEPLTATAMIADAENGDKWKQKYGEDFLQYQSGLEKTNSALYDLFGQMDHAAPDDTVLLDLAIGRIFAHVDSLERAMNTLDWLNLAQKNPTPARVRFSYSMDSLRQKLYMSEDNTATHAFDIGGALAVYTDGGVLDEAAAEPPAAGGDAGGDAKPADGKAGEGKKNIVIRFISALWNAIKALGSKLAEWGKMFGTKLKEWKNGASEWLSAAGTKAMSVAAYPGVKLLSVAASQAEKTVSDIMAVALKSANIKTPEEMTAYEKVCTGMEAVVAKLKGTTDDAAKAENANIQGKDALADATTVEGNVSRLNKIMDSLKGVLSKLTNAAKTVGVAARAGAHAGAAGAAFAASAVAFSPIGAINIAVSLIKKAISVVSKLIGLVMAAGKKIGGAIAAFKSKFGKGKGDETAGGETPPKAEGEAGGEATATA